MKSNRLKHLYVEELKDLYSAENQLVKAIPKMAKASTFPDLRAGFEEHLGRDEGACRAAGADFQSSRGIADGQEMQGHGGPD